MRHIELNGYVATLESNCNAHYFRTWEAAVYYITKGEPMEELDWENCHVEGWGTLTWEKPGLGWISSFSFEDL